jgi:hypothetical protein
MGGFMNKNAQGNVVQLRIARDRLVHPTGDPNAFTRQASWNREPTVHGQSITYGRLLEQLEAENKQLRAHAMDLVRQIRALRNSIAALTTSRRVPSLALRRKASPRKKARQTICHCIILGENPGA